jgi:hypothetical protein
LSKVAADTLDSRHPEFLPILTAFPSTIVVMKACGIPAMYEHYFDDEMEKSNGVCFPKNNFSCYHGKSLTHWEYEAVKKCTMVRFVCAHHTMASAGAMSAISGNSGSLLLRPIACICGDIGKPRRQLRRQCPIHTLRA